MVVVWFSGLRGAIAFALAMSLDTDNAVDTTSIHEALRARRAALERATRTLHGLP